MVIFSYLRKHARETSLVRISRLIRFINLKNNLLIVFDDDDKCSSPPMYLFVCFCPQHCIKSFISNAVSF